MTGPDVPSLTDVRDAGRWWVTASRMHPSLGKRVQAQVDDLIGNTVPDATIRALVEDAAATRTWMLDDAPAPALSSDGDPPVRAVVVATARVLKVAPAAVARLEFTLGIDRPTAVRRLAVVVAHAEAQDGPLGDAAVRAVVDRACDMWTAFY